MHLSSIDSICISATRSTDVALEEEEVKVITIDLVPEIGKESIIMDNKAGFDVEVMDFANGQLVLVPSRKHSYGTRNN